MSKVFISYRRDDSAGYAHAIYRELLQHFAKDQVFMDVDTLEPGVDFVHVIEEAVSECDVLIALIGTRWVNVGSLARSRLDDPNDFVRLEVSTALARDIRVIPVLVDGMRMPNAKSLPAPLKLLSRRNAIEISNSRFNYDVDQLIAAVRKILDEIETKRKADEENRKRVEEKTNRAQQDPELRLSRNQPSIRQPTVEPPRGELKPGTFFCDRLKDGSQGPEMAVVPTGTFRMGNSKSNGKQSERPVHTVQIIRPFAIGRYEVTFEEYDQFANTTGRELPGDEGWGRGQRPVINVSWNDAAEYAKWLSAQTGKRYRLPSEAEWEYAARGGGKEDGWAGTSSEQELVEYAWYNANSGGKTHPVGGKKPNGLGLCDLSGNVWEWVEDGWHANYKGAPTDGSAWKENVGQCVLRGGSWGELPEDLRSSTRLRGNSVFRLNEIGFRLGQTID